MLDVGTGTGVLAIALAKRTHIRMIASDIDPVATRTTVQNARDNEVGPQIEAVTAAGLDHPVIARHGPYDLIVANILAGPLAAIAPNIRRAAAHGATVILSGLLRSQAPRIVSVYASQGVVLRRRIERGDWATLVLGKP